MSEDDGWDNYLNSVQLFPGCKCGHDATEHMAAWGDWRNGDGCLIPNCDCSVEWKNA